MYSKARNEITFPHVIPGNILGGKEHTFNSVNGGTKPINKFGLVSNTFLGGRCIELGFIKEYGFYACKEREGRRILAFYADDPKNFTELGRKLISQKFEGKNVIFELYSDLPVDPIDFEKREQARKEAIENGISPEVVSHLSANEISGLLKAVQSGKAETPAGVDQPILPTVTTEPVRQVRKAAR